MHLINRLSLSKVGLINIQGRPFKVPGKHMPGRKRDLRSLRSKMYSIITEKRRLESYNLIL